MSHNETTQLRLDASIPANNYKIIEIYNKVKKEEWIVRPRFQRKLVWKKQHKINFIETILLNYPFPEIYIAPGELDSNTLTYSDIVVDGQQRTTTIVNYIEGKDIFSQSSKKIKPFRSLSETEKRMFLNFEVSIRYLKNATNDQIKNIFQRINSSEYSLNQIEKHHAQYSDSEFMLFAKQIIETEIDEEMIDYKINPDNRKLLHSFFVKESQIFSSNDLDRMLALQYIMTLIATMLEKGEYFNRLIKNEYYIEKFNSEFVDAYIYEKCLIDIVGFIKELNISNDSIWYTKSNLFTLIIELYKFNNFNGKALDDVDKVGFASVLEDFERNYYIYMSDKDHYQENIQGEIQYFEAFRQGVNDSGARRIRGDMMQDFIQKSI